MFAGKNIDRHKEDIEKRIQELSEKLKESKNLQHHFRDNPRTNESNIGQPSVLEIQPPEDRYLREEKYSRFQRYNKNEEYVEPQQVTKIRNALKQREVQENTEVGNKAREDPRFKYESSQSKEFTRTNQGRKEDDKIYEMMSEILKNQRNLENQIHMLREQWYKEQKQKVQKPSQSLIMNISKNSIPEQDNYATFEVTNVYDNLHNNIPKQQTRKSFRPSHGNNGNREQPTLKRKTETEERSFIKEPERQKKNPSAKKNQVPQNQPNVMQEIAKIVKNQKSRCQRFSMNEQQKGQFWKLVQQRIKESENEYSDADHRNNRFEHDHLVNTQELQRKLKEDLLGKIYAQCNSCIYK